jgi:hypothetical protein
LADVRDLDGCELEHSNNGQRFEKLASLPGNGGLNYSYLDRQLSAGSHFYRLLVKEKSGRTFYSQVVLLVVGKLQTRIIGLQQNPVRGKVTPLIVSANNQPVRASITDALGRMIFTRQTQLQTGQNQWPINLPTLASGIYFIHVRTGDGVEGTLKFVKE